MVTVTIGFHFLLLSTQCLREAVAIGTTVVPMLINWNYNTWDEMTFILVSTYPNLKLKCHYTRSESHFFSCII